MKSSTVTKTLSKCRKCQAVMIKWIAHDTWQKWKKLFMIKWIATTEKKTKKEICVKCHWRKRSHLKFDKNSVSLVALAFFSSSSSLTIYCIVSCLLCATHTPISIVTLKTEYAIPADFYLLSFRITLANINVLNRFSDFMSNLVWVQRDRSEKCEVFSIQKIFGFRYSNAFASWRLIVYFLPQLTLMQTYCLTQKSVFLSKQ